MIGEVQNAFINGRYILDKSFCGKGGIDYIKLTRGRGMVLKVDFEKAFDSFKWGLEPSGVNEWILI